MLGNSPMGNECELRLAPFRYTSSYSGLCPRSFLCFSIFPHISLSLSFSPARSTRSRAPLVLDHECSCAYLARLAHVRERTLARIMPRRSAPPTCLPFLYCTREIGCRDASALALFIRRRNPDRETGPIRGTCLADRGRRSRGPPIAAAMRLPLIIRVYASEIRGESRLQSP